MNLVHCIKLTSNFFSLLNWVDYFTHIIKNEKFLILRLTDRLKFDTAGNLRNS